MFLDLSSCTLVRAEDGMLIQQGFGEVVLVIRNSYANKQRSFGDIIFDDQMSPNARSQIMIVLCWFLVDSE